MKIELATAPVSWGVVMKDTPNVPPYSQVLDEMSEAGYKGTELGLCPDTAHTMYGGHDPIALIKRYPDCIRHLHIKECDKTVLAQILARKGDYFDGVVSRVFPELGRGSVDFKAIHKTLAEIDFSGWAVIEQDILPNSGLNAFESARHNLAYLKNAGW